jgi:beta-glucosidase
MALVDELRFPKDFVWGASTSAQQIEGAVKDGGRAPSIWDTFCYTAGAVANGDTANDACDSYNRLDEDLEIIRRLGLQSYRFSIAWSRVQPEGRGALNPEGIDYYRRLVDGLLELGVTPAATLYHWDLPQAVQDAGGWPSRDTAYLFSDYAAAVADALEGTVAQWTTIHEPWSAAFLGHRSGRHAPGEQDLSRALAASHHLLLGHGLAIGRLRSLGVDGETAQAGIALTLMDLRSPSNDPSDLNAQWRVDGDVNRWFLDPLRRGRYPADMLDWWSRQGADIDFVRDGDLYTIASDIDFLTVSYHPPMTLVGATPDPAIADDLTPLGAAVGPDIAHDEEDTDSTGLYALLDRIRHEYGTVIDHAPIPIYVTDNGFAAPDDDVFDGRIEDADRIAALRARLAVIHRAIEDGVDVRGYFAGAMLDGFEWHHGYDRQRGLVHVDHETQRRVAKASAQWYSRIITANVVPADIDARPLATTGPLPIIRSTDDRVPTLH